MEVAPGTTIIQAMKDHELEIAHYCWHPGLSIAGVCRLCMVEIDGNPRLQIACNTVVTDGMVINNVSPKVKETVKWGLDFHLINHPLDCPICDQAGECELQIQYMKFGQYDSEMAEKKVKKRKVVDLGPTVVLDAERCILCSRCVRFTAEVSKTNELGIFNRGDHSEIGTVEDRPLDNNYSVNTIDICPVGALTSKDFRFRQRVWYLKEQETVCNGCSTGCNVSAYYNEEGFWRVKPVYNPEVNGHWMCDKGRDIYKFVNRDSRQIVAQRVFEGRAEDMEAGQAARLAGERLRSLSEGTPSIAVVLTGQYTVEEYRAMVDLARTHFKTNLIYHWINNPESSGDFDGLLYRGDKNPNTKGLTTVLQEAKVGAPWADLESRLATGTLRGLVVAGPEIPANFPDLPAKIELFKKSPFLVWLSAGLTPALESATRETYLIPTKTFVEKSGTFVNYQGREQRIERITTVVKGALSLTEAAALMSGRDLEMSVYQSEKPRKTNYFAGQRERANEFGTKA
jgi:NADH-quinone oxidoreductase subunit G